VISTQREILPEYYFKGELPIHDNDNEILNDDSIFRLAKMAFYPQFFPYAYPVPYPGQEFYGNHPPVYGPPGSSPPQPGAVYFDHIPQDGHHPRHHHRGPPVVKQGFANRKDSADSGISDFSVASSASRKTSSTSIASVSSVADESALDDIKEETPYEEPDDDLCEKIVQQVEFYFSDANITKDKFLLKHVKRNKEGFVSLKLISSFKRVKHLTRDWRQVAAAIERKSSALEVNDVKTKVRRLAELPEYDETTPSRTVVALNLPLERPTIEGVAELFSACGEIVLIRILRPGNPIPADVKPFANKHPEVSTKTCALVEFERTEFAHKAVAQLNNEDDEEKMQVMELTAPPPKTTKNKEDKKKSSVGLMKQPTAFQSAFSAGLSSGPAPQRRFSHAGFNPPSYHTQAHSQAAVAAAAAAAENATGARRRISLHHNMKFTPINEEHGDKGDAADHLSLNPNAPAFHMQAAHQQQHVPHKRYSHGGFYAHPNAATAAAMEAAAAAAFTVQMQMSGPPPTAVGPSPWMLRRMSQHAEMAASGLALPPNVIRMPRGPDKGKGFQRWCKNRMETQSQPQPQKKVSRAVPIVAPPNAEEEKPAKEQAKAEAVAAESLEVVEGAAAALLEALPKDEEEKPAGGAAAAAVEADANLIVVTGDSSSDSGNEDASDQELDAANVNERSR